MYNYGPPQENSAGFPCNPLLNLVKTAQLYSSQLGFRQDARSEAYTYVGEQRSNDVKK